MFFKKKTNETEACDAIKPTKEDVLRVLACKTPPCRQHVNYINQLDGLPLIQNSDRSNSATVIFATERLRRYAVEMGYVND